MLPPSNKRGRREDRVHAAPAVSCAIAHKERAHEHTGTGGASRPSLRSGFTAYNVISPVNGSFATVALFSKNLTPAPRRQDHTTSSYASCALAFCAIRVHRIPPRVRDDREPPLVTGETRGIKSVICPTARAEYFCARGWTVRRSRRCVICPSGRLTIFAVPRGSVWAKSRPHHLRIATYCSPAPGTIAPRACWLPDTILFGETL